MQSSCNYNLAISSILIKQIYEKQIRLKKEMRKMRIKLSRLKKELDFLKDKEKEIIIIK